MANAAQPSVFSYRATVTRNARGRCFGNSEVDAETEENTLEQESIRSSLSEQKVSRLVLPT